MRKAITILLAVVMTLGSALNLNLAYAFAESAITVDKEVTESSTEAGNVKSYIFVPEESGTYEFSVKIEGESTDNILIGIQLLDSEHNLLAESKYRKNAITLQCDLQEGETYYFTYSRMGYAGKITGTAKTYLVAKAPEEIKNDTIVQFTTTEENEITLFKFIPEETGWYKYYSADEKRYTVEGIIYDSNKNAIERSDNYIEGLHGTTLELNGPFSMISYFEAGKVYYLGSRTPYNVGEFEIGIKKVGKATSMSINQSDSTTVNIGQQRSFNLYFDPVDCEPEKITWTSDNTDVMEVDENGICYFKKLGKATLTATTESGLKDSLEVNVVNYQELKTDEEVQIVAGAGKSGGFTFIPDKNGSYNFSVKLSDFRVGLTVKLYDKNYQLITKERNTFNTIDICSELVSGETYYLVYSSDKGDIWTNATITATIKTDDIVSEFEKGDLNKDNIISADDALEILKIAAKIK